ncbi:MAG: hypothetical protein V9G23_12805 [Giesbergeria sp.]
MTEDAVALFRPDVVLAPFLKRRIPQAVWAHTVCLVVHPGVPGDRGPSALDWMLMRGDAALGRDRAAGRAAISTRARSGPGEPFDVRPGATKSSVYRREVTQAAVVAVLRALQRHRAWSVCSPRLAGAVAAPGPWPMAAADAASRAPHRLAAR